MKTILYSNTDLIKLESWRGLLSVFVFIAHLFQILWYPLVGTENYIVVLVGTVANISVVCFFMLSGMLIAYSGSNLISHNQFNWRKYIINRISRIYPSYIFILLISLILIPVFFYLNHSSYIIQKLPTDKYIAREQFYCSSNDFLLALQMRSSDIIQLNGPLWSLIVEWWLYISGLFGILFLTFGTKQNLGKIISIILGTIPLLYIYFNYGVNSIYYILIWFLGFLYTLFLYKHIRLFNIIMYISIIAVVIMVLYFGTDSINIMKANPNCYGILQVSIAMIFLKIMFKISFPLFFNKIGNFSYTLYICHFPLILFSFALTRNLTKNDPLLTALEMIVLFGTIMFISYIISLQTENKSFFRNYLYKLNSKIKTQ